MPHHFWDYFAKTSPKHQRHIQDGLFQIASQTCSLLVQVNNTNNISFGDNATNIHYNNLHSPRSSTFSGSGSESSSGITSRPGSSKDQDQLVVLLPPTPEKIIRNKCGNNTRTFGKRKLSTVLESPSCAINHDEVGDLWSHTYMLPDNETGFQKKWNKETWCKPSCIPITIILVLIFLVVLLPLLDHAMTKPELSSLIKPEDLCRNSCRIMLVESIPDDLFYPNESIRNVGTGETWLNLISSAEETIEIASFYWTLRQSDIYPEPSYQGEKVFKALLNAGTKRNISIRIAQNAPNRNYPNTDSEYLVKKKAAEVRSLNFVQLLGNGVLHTKLWVIDRKHFYIGSANMDWRSLTEVKELGLVAYNCTCLAEDMGKIFDIYWYLGNNKAKIPTHWPVTYGTDFNIESPLKLELNAYTFNTYISSSPPPFLAYGRSNDIDAILHVIQTAEKFIYIAVMNYSPQFLFTPKIKYWPIIDDALRVAAIEHSVKVRLLISLWNHTSPSEQHFLKSLSSLNQVHPKVSIEVGFFVIPSNSNESKIPYARVNHNKYMVTDNTAYIGTSNWSADYFTDTAGVGLIMHDFDVIHRNESERTVRRQLQEVFERDWNSNHTILLKDYNYNSNYYCKS